MQITLSRKCSMWFLGHPKNLIVSLNFKNPGPVAFDFNKLPPDLQKSVLNAIQQGLITSNTPFHELHALWAKSQPAVTEVPKSPVQKQAEEQLAQRMAFEAERTAREAKEMEKINYILQYSHKAVRASLTGEKDTHFLRKMLQEEKKTRNRATVVSALQEKITRLETAVAKEIARKSVKDIKASPEANFPREKIRYTIEESEFQTIVLTPEELITETLK